MSGAWSEQENIKILEALENKNGGELKGQSWWDFEKKREKRWAFFGVSFLLFWFC